MFKTRQGLLNKIIVYIQLALICTSTMKAVWLLLACLGCTGSERILGVFPFPGKSHFFTFEPVLAELARRGHELTVIGYFPNQTPIKGYNDIVLTEGSIEDFMIPLTELININLDVPVSMNHLAPISYTFENIYKDKRVIDLLNSTMKFDLIITEMFMSDMFLGLAEKYNAPIIMLSSSELNPWATDRFGVPDNPSYIKHFFNYRSSGPMSLYGRLMNTAEVLYAKYIYNSLVTTNDEVVSRRYLGVKLGVREAMTRISLLLVNTHFTVNMVRPLPPQVVEIGGIHIKPVKPLPQDIELFLNESTQGVLYFSFGSITNASTMSVEMRKAFCNVFSRLPQRVLWKWELDTMPDKPQNVKIVKWAPQRDILAHPNVRLFMSHGGLLGTMEAVDSGVPIVGIPLFGDQPHNVAHLEDLGYAIRLDLNNITEESVSYAVNTVLNNPRYQKTADRISQLFRDRPMTPLDTAVYWTEYVLKHGGSHLQSAAVHLTWYQYLLLDVIGALVLAVTVALVLIYYTVKIGLKKIFKSIKVKVS